MAPAGVKTLFQHLDIMTFSSLYGPVSASMKLASSPSSISSLPTNTSLTEFPSALASIHSDHDYFIKPQMCSAEGIMVTEGADQCGPSVDNHNCGGDAMLSSCAIDFEKVTDEGRDTDFLKDLDDLNFSFNDLDPCCEVAMEDSFQDFIDSALEESYPSCLSDDSTGKHIQTHSQDAVILNKEQFLAVLNLRSTHANKHRDEFSPPSSTSVVPASPFSSNSLSDEAAPDMNCHASSDLNAKGVSSYDVIPTRQCSCVELESVFKAVYSTAHPPYQDCVRTCPSTLITSTKGSNECTDCSQNNRTPEILMSPLFIDTSSTAFSDSCQPSSDDCLDILMEEDTPLKADKETVDIMKWLGESQQKDQHQFNDSNNNVVSRLYVNVATMFAETPNEGSIVAPSLDFESFVDLEDFETETVDKDDKQKIGIDYTCSRTDDQSKNSRSSPYISQFKLSMLTECLGSSDKCRQGSYSDVYSESSLSDKLSPNSSDLSYCVFSPAWFRTDSMQSSVSPLPVTSMDFSFSSNFEDDIDDTSVKSPLALLNLFSDENATSLLHSDSTVPNIRYM